jgi:hypothetical protein
MRHFVPTQWGAFANLLGHGMARHAFADFIAVTWPHKRSSIFGLVVQQRRPPWPPLLAFFSA